jgi:hypothetical protein
MVLRCVPWQEVRRRARRRADAATRQHRDAETRGRGDAEILVYRPLFRFREHPNQSADNIVIVVIQLIELIFF